MFPYAQLLVSALLATSVLSAPAPAPATPSGGGVFRQIITQGVDKLINKDDLSELVKSDYARARSARSGTLAGDAGGPMNSFVGALSKNGTSSSLVGSAHATNKGIYYTTAVMVGNPGSTYQLIIDTGSANTWVGGGKKYVKTATSLNSGARMTVNYQAAQMQGYLYYDKVAISSTMQAQSQAIGVSTTTRGFEGSDGVLAVGPKRLSRGTTSQGTTVEFPTITDTLFQKGVITQNVVSLSFQPTNAVGTINGQITFGGVDTTRYTGKITYAPLTTKYPANAYWGIDASSVAYGTTKLFTQTAIPAIVESGLTLVYLASDAFAKYKTATGAVLDTKTGLLKITNAQYNALKPLDLTIAGTKFTLTPNAQIWSRALNKAIGGVDGAIYLTVADLGTKSGSGLDVILGQEFFERHYITMDTTGKRVGIATTAWTNSTMH